MEPLRWVALGVLTLFLLEGFVLSVFPEQFKRMLSDADPGSLQLAGFFETILAIVLMAAALWL
jgi:uncharacterized protein YjeT (DUF2065 family)